MKIRTIAVVLAISLTTLSFNSLANISSEIQKDYKGRSGIVKINGQSPKDFITIQCLEGDEILVGYTPSRRGATSPRVFVGPGTPKVFFATESYSGTLYLSVNTSRSELYIAKMLSRSRISIELKNSYKPDPYKQLEFEVTGLAEHFENVCSWHPDFARMIRYKR